MGIVALAIPATAHAGKVGFTFCQADTGSGVTAKRFMSQIFQSHWYNGGWEVEVDEDDALGDMLAMNGIHEDGPQDALRENFARALETSQGIKLDRAKRSLRCYTDKNNYAARTLWYANRDEATSEGQQVIRIRTWASGGAMNAERPSEPATPLVVTPTRTAFALLEYTIPTYWDQDDSRVYMVPALKVGVAAHRAADKPVVNGFGEMKSLSLVSETNGEYLYRAKHENAIVEWRVRHNGDALTSIYFKKVG